MMCTVIIDLAFSNRGIDGIRGSVPYRSNDGGYRYPWFHCFVGRDSGIGIRGGGNQL
jgi:hypothetical protein